MKNYLILTLFLLLSLFFSNVFAQKMVEGRVLSEKNKEPIPYATIQGMGESIFVYADEKGNFKITLSDSTEKLLITSSGFTKKEMQIPLQAKRIAFDISLKPVEVKAKKEPKKIEAKPNADIEENTPAIIPNGQPQPLNMNEIRQKINNSFAENNIEGNVSLRVLVNEEGKYIKHTLLNDVQPLLAAEVEKYIKEIRFAPIIQGGKAVKFSVNVQFSFKLR